MAKARKSYGIKRDTDKGEGEINYCLCVTSFLNDPLREDYKVNKVCNLPMSVKNANKNFTI